MVRCSAPLSQEDDGHGSCLDDDPSANEEKKAVASIVWPSMVRGDGREEDPPRNTQKEEDIERSPSIDGWTQCGRCLHLRRLHRRNGKGRDGETITIRKERNSIEIARKTASPRASSGSDVFPARWNTIEIDRVEVEEEEAALN